MSLSHLCHMSFVAMIAVLAAGCSEATSDVALPTDGNVTSTEPLKIEIPGGAADNMVGADPGDTIGGDGSPILLSALSPPDVEGARLAGELGCSFSADGKPLLVAKGDVGASGSTRGVVKVGDYVEPVGVRGGFNAMVKGASFSGQGKSVRIAIVGAAIGGGESPAYPATLTYDRADGARRVFDGRWNCGP